MPQKSKSLPDASASADPQRPPAEPPVWSKRYWTGSGAVEVAVFRRTVSTADGSFATYSTAAKRTYKDGDEYRSVHSFWPADLLPLAHGLTEAFSWIAQQERS
jgi:hypothetical protein